MRPERILWWQAQALYLLSLEDDHAGQHEQADARRRGLGLLRDFWVLGPFDAQGRSGLERIYPAELALPDPRGGPCYFGQDPRSSAGAERLPRVGAPGGGRARRPFCVRTTMPFAYLLAYVHKRSGTLGGLCVWARLVRSRHGSTVAPVMSRDVVRSAALDQDSAALWLPRGKSVLLVKTVVTTGIGRCSCA